MPSSKLDEGKIGEDLVFAMDARGIVLHSSG
jgi:hypothetical protein